MICRAEDRLEWSVRLLAEVWGSRVWKAERVELVGRGSHLDRRDSFLLD